MKKRRIWKVWNVMVESREYHWYFIGAHYFRFMAIRHAKEIVKSDGFNAVVVENADTGYMAWTHEVRQ
jgi:hypothetical protein